MQIKGLVREPIESFGRRPRPAPPISSVKRSRVRRFFSFPGLVAGLLGLFSLRPLSAMPPASYNGYVIVTSNATASACAMRLQNFKHLKELQGYSTRIVTESDFGGLTGQAPNGTAEKIRKWLQDNRDPLKIKYVLLIGNPDPDDPLPTPEDYPQDKEHAVEVTGDIPMKMCFPLYHDAHCERSATDYFYADLTGNWDLDGDGLYGEDLAVDRPRSPRPRLIDPDFFTARWEGKIEITEAARYQFMTYSDDGMRVYLDGDLANPVLDDWVDHAPRLKESGFISISKGLHDIRVDYHQEGGDAIAMLYWETEAPSGGSQKIGHWTKVGSESLYNLDPATGSYVKGGLLAVYGMPGTRARFTEVGNIDKIWFTGDNGTGGRKKTADVIVGRIPLYGNNYGELDAILAKIIDYETDTGDLSWRKSIFIPHMKMYASGPTYVPGECIKNDVADPAGFRSFRIYWENFAPSGPTPELWPAVAEDQKDAEFKDILVNEWANVPYGLMVSFSHGGPTGSVIDSSRTPELNDAYPAFAFVGACGTFWPEHPANLGYALLRNGGVVGVGATRESYYGDYGCKFPDPASSLYDSMGYEYAKAIVGSATTPPMTAGEALFSVKEATKAEDFGSNVMEYTLYGDPSCSLLSVYMNERPVAKISGPLSAVEGDSITIDGSASYDPEGDSILFRWDTNDDGVWEKGWSGDAVLPVVLFKPGVQTVRMQARDSLGKVQTASHSTTVYNVPPTVDAGPDKTINEGDVFNFSGSFTDPGRESYTYAITYGDAPGLDTGAAFTGIPITGSHLYPNSGVFPVTLMVDDGNGGTGSDAMTVTVLNVAPVAEAGPDFTALARATAYFSGSWSDPGNDVNALEWDFGDGAPKVSGTLNPTHVYEARGTYTVRFTVTDADGAVGTDTLKVKVVENPLSFENPGQPWTRGSNNFSVGVDTTLKTEGNSSVRFDGSGNMVLNSPKFKAKDLLGYSNVMQLDVYMPSPAANPYWMGTVQIYITSSNPVFNNRMVGQAILTGLPMNQWNTVSFSVASDVYKAFATPECDIQLSIVVNTSQAAANPYRIDNLRFYSR